MPHDVGPGMDWGGMAQGDDERLEAWLSGRATGRAVVIVAHPDDEILGCGALLPRLRDVEIMHVTDGAPRNGDDAHRHGFASIPAYAAARAREAREALALAGVPAMRVSCLGVSDQEVSRHLADVAARLVPRLTGVDLVLTHAFEGGHSDHDAVAFAAHTAWAALPPARPLLVEMPFYHAAVEGWRRQAFLPQPGAGEECVLRLDAAQQEHKRRMMALHRSQAETLRGFDLATERFRCAPPYDFLQRPHAGDLLYERHGWNLDWPGWVACVRAAQRSLADAHACP